MTIRAKVDLSALKKTLPQIKEQFKKDLPKPLASAIRKDILRGISPVKGKRFARYSRSYSEAKSQAGHPRVVNLRLTGKLLKSLRAINRKGKELVMEFKNPLAFTHNDVGAGNNKHRIRRMLPDKRGERFNSQITNLLSNTIVKAALKIIRRNNR